MWQQARTGFCRIRERLSPDFYSKGDWRPNADIFRCEVLWRVLRFSPVIGERLGLIGLKIVIRIFGLIPVAIAVEVIVNVLGQLFP